MAAVIICSDFGAPKYKVAGLLSALLLLLVSLRESSQAQTAFQLQLPGTQLCKEAWARPL